MSNKVTYGFGLDRQPVVHEYLNRLLLTMYPSFDEYSGYLVPNIVILK